MRNDLIGIKDTSVEGDLYQIADILGEAGIQNLEYSVLHYYKEQEIWDTQKRKQVLKLLEERGLNINSVFMSLMSRPEFNLLSDDEKTYTAIKGIISNVIEYCHELRSSIVILPFFNNDLFLSKGLETFVERVSDICEIAERNSVNLLIENSLNAKINKRLIERVNPCNLKICFDTGNSYGFVGDINGEINYLKEYVGEIHLKDFPVDLDIGDGEIDFQTFIQNIVFGCGNIPVIIEKNSGKYNSITCLKKIREHICEM